MAVVRLQGEREKSLNIYYEVDASKSPIGEGGMGRVYLGYCVDAVTKITRPVAIKFLYDGLPQYSVERARREASIQLKNDNLVEMLGFIETETVVNGKPMPHYHVVSELLHGVALSDVLDGKCEDSNGKTIAYAEKLYNDFKSDSAHFAKVVISNILNALVALHDAGYVHRDIDPTNIMVTDDEHIKLIDFGISKQVNKLTTNDRSLTTEGVFIGKAEYAAPELALGDTKHQDMRTDIYAMGILLYHCIVGHAPFEGTTNEVLKKQLNDKPNLSVIHDKGLRKIISIAINKNQHERYQTASQMRVALERLDGLKRKMSAATRARLIALAIVVIVVIAAIVVCLKHNAAVEQREAEIALQAINDSLKSEAIKLIKLGDVKFSVGTQHNEGYEISLIDAYNNYLKARKILVKLDSTKADSHDVTLKINNAKNELDSAKVEFDEKAAYFEQNDMPDIANDFKARSEKIQKSIANK